MSALMRCLFCGARLASVRKSSAASLSAARLLSAPSSRWSQWKSGGGAVDAVNQPRRWTSSASFSSRFHMPGENHTTDGYVVTPNTAQLLATHLQETGGKVITRFPPEPNGVLHIGHAMAINFSFGYARANEGVCYLRYDDTNPEKAEERFVREIKEMVEWLGHRPYKITYASDHFPQLYKYALELINRDHAYVCHQPPSEVRDREAPPSQWRDRPKEESLRLFEEMKAGQFKEGEATLRMKMTLGDGKRDPIAYRVKTTTHPRTGHTWCIYPTYDYAHALCDSLENITHSFCSKEFQAKRPSYYWLCNALDVYCPVQWEFSRLNVSHTLVSKRKIQPLIDAGIVSDWDDPRLYTLSALRRRGFPPEAINDFCESYGVLQSDGVIYPELIESFVRKSLNKTAIRAMAVLDPVKVIITNFPYPEEVELTVPNVPRDPEQGQHIVPFSKELYIDRGDFKEEADNGYWRLTPTQPVGLNHASCVISVKDVLKDSEGKVCELHVECKIFERGKMARKDRPRSFIHWVSNPLPCTFRIFNKLFTVESPEEAKDGILSVVNPTSLREYPGAIVEQSVLNAPSLTRYQFERIGYFCVDPDSSSDKLVFNSTLPLKESPSNPTPGPLGKRKQY
ncbi:glutamine--tRNA ligase-like [Halichondria panicea]|uniref:glutamine--tRNA ligase-like n=1 Tax=Halichondria panicea TaxID=6063 RepID=UPI00312B4A42